MHAGRPSLPDDGPRTVRGSAPYRRLLAALAVGGLANFALLYYVQPLLPELAEAFRISDGASGLALSATTVAMIVGLLLAGPLADRIGRVRAMTWSLIGTGLLGALSAAAPTWEGFLAARMAMGVGLAILPAVAIAYIKDRVAHDAHLHANSIYIVGTALGGAVGRLVPLPLAALGTWHLPTVVLGALSVLCGVALGRLLPADHGLRRALHLGDILRSTLGALGDRGLALLGGLGFANTAVFVAVYNAVSFRLSEPPFSLGQAEALVYLAYAACLIAPALFRGAAARRGRPAATALGFALAAASLALLVPEHVATIVIGLALLTIAFIGTHSILTGWAVQRAHETGQSTSRASAAYLICFYLGSTVAGGTATAVWVAAGWPGVTVLGASMILLAAVLLVAIAVLRRRAPGDPVSEPGPTVDE